MSEDLKTAGHVDLQRYLGTWYEIARKPMRHEDAWLLHRAPQMEPAAKNEWLEFARMRGYDLDDLIHPSQSGQVHREAEAERS